MQKITVEHHERTTTGWDCLCSDNESRSVTTDELLQSLYADRRGMIGGDDDYPPQTLEQWLEENEGLELQCRLASIITKRESRNLTASDFVPTKNLPSLLKTIAA